MKKLKVDMNMGKNLRKLRKENGYKQKEIIAQINVLGIDVSRSIYARYETGELNIPVSILIALHYIYKCSFDAFFSGLDLKVYQKKPISIK